MNAKQKSDFCSVKTAEQALEDIIQNAQKKKNFIHEYMENAEVLLTILQIKW